MTRPRARISRVLRSKYMKDIVFESTIFIIIVIIIIRAPLCSLDCPRIHCIHQVDLELTDLPVSASQLSPSSWVAPSSIPYSRKSGGDAAVKLPNLEDKDPLPETVREISLIMDNKGADVC